MAIGILYQKGTKERENIMRLDKHPILKQAYDVMQAIEECGASEKLTHAVTLAGKLMEDIDVLVDAIYPKRSSIL